VTFAPQNSGSVSGALQISSNASNPSVSVALTGTGSTVQHSVDVNWGASTSTVAGYNVYRGTVSDGPYSKVNTTLIPGLTFTDTTVSSGATYFYVVTAVAADGTESPFSSQVQAAIPNP
jgi:fibronectin type 3 domain-containing protein